MEKNQDYYSAYLLGYDDFNKGSNPNDCPFDEEERVNLEGWMDGYNDAIERVFS